MCDRRRNSHMGFHQGCYMELHLHSGLDQAKRVHVQLTFCAGKFGGKYPRQSCPLVHQKHSDKQL